MSDTVKPDERGILRLYALDLPPGQASGFGTEPLAAALGVPRLDPGQVERIRLADLEEIGLAGYLAEGWGVAPETIDRAALERRTPESGIVFLVRSRAFEGRPATLEPRPPVRALGRFAEPGLRLEGPPMPEVESARPGSAPPPPEAEETDVPAPPGEPVRERFRPDRETYIRDHLWIAALGMVGATLVLYLMGNGEPWVGAIAALLAVAVRGTYLLSEEMGHVWELTESALRGPGGRHVPLAAIRAVRTLGSAVQIVTTAGDKHLIKFQAEPKRVRARIAAAAGHAP